MECRGTAKRLYEIFEISLIAHLSLIMLRTKSEYKNYIRI